MELEIKVMWCKGLTAGPFNFFQKLSVYTAVSITSDDKSLKLTQAEQQQQKTPVDQEGDGSPEWNHTMKFNLRSPNIGSNLHRLSLLFELRMPGQLFGDKEIGEVRVPLKELVQSVGIGVTRLVSYEVRCPDGKHNGVLDFSYKVIDDGKNLGDYGLGSQFPISGYGHRYHRHQESHDNPGSISESEPDRILGNCASDPHIRMSSYGHLHQESHVSNNGHLGHCVSDSGMQISGYGYHSQQESHISNTKSEWGRIQNTNNGHLGHCVSDYRIETCGYGYHSQQESHVSDWSLSSVSSERIQYPKVDSELIPSPWQPPPAPPPPPVHYSPPPPPPCIPTAPPPRDQQPYAYHTPPYWGYGRPPPSCQQTRGGGYEYPHW